MSQTATTTAPRFASTALSTERTSALLAAGAVAGPIWIAVAAMQAIARDGFDLARHPISVLSNGDFGWVQIANFVVCGLLFIAGAVGMRGRLSPGRGATWGPRLLALIGIGMIGSGVFVADPLDGFPPGTPLGTPDEISWHGGLHFMFATVSFVAQVAAAFLMARRFAADGAHAFARYSVASGILFVIAWAALMASRRGDVPTVGLAVGAAVMLIWASALCARLRHRN